MLNLLVIDDVDVWHLSIAFHSLQPGRRRMVWAYHYTNDTTVCMNGMSKHTLSGFEEIDFLKQPREKPVVEASNRDPPTTGASAIAASIIGNLLLFIIAVIFFY